MAVLPWQWWLPTAIGRNGTPDAEQLAAGLRRFANGEEPVDPGLLLALADMLDNPSGYAGAKLKLTRARGGRRPQFDWVEAGRVAYEAIERGVKPDAAIFETAKTTGCDERTVRRALANYRIGMAADSEASD